MTGAGDEKGIQIVRFNDPVEMGVDKIQTRCSAPVAEQTRLDIFQSEGPAEQRVIEKIDLSDGKIIGRTPIGLDTLELFGGEWIHEIITLFRGRPVGGREHPWC